VSATFDTHGPPDAELVGLAQAGDRKALDRLVRRHNDVAWRVAMSVVRDGDLAQDVVQTTWVKAVQGLSAFRGEAEFRTWLLSIVVNTGRSELRSRGRHDERSIDVVPELDDPSPAPDVLALRGDEAARACVALATLPEKQRLSVELRINEGLSFREVGEAIGSSEGAARVNYHHGIRRLREIMET
jgi:RNA polymerase sigma-70 factor (ECF subfamily)